MLYSFIYIWQLSTQHVSAELASNQTMLYIQKLEQETEKLKKQIKDVTSQLQTVKVLITIKNKFFTNVFLCVDC